MSQANQLLDGSSAIGILGMGYVGYSTMLRFLRAGVRCVVTDFDADRRAALIAGTYPPANRFLFWKEMAEFNYMTAHRRFEVVAPDQLLRPDVNVFFIGLPFGHDEGRGVAEIRRAVALLAGIKGCGGHPLVVVETSLAPGTMDRLVAAEFAAAGLATGTDFTLAYAPRRDWSLEDFLAEGQPARLVAARPAADIARIAAVLAASGQQTVELPSFAAAEIAQCFEGALAHTATALAAQLSFAYPEADCRAAFAVLAQLTGRAHSPLNPGFELPLATQFLLEAAPNPGFLTILNEAMSAYFSTQQAVVEMLKRHDITQVALLGLLPHENRAEHDSSPALALPRLLRRQGMDVRIHDPFLSTERVKALTECKALGLPDGLAEAQAVLLLTPHAGYTAFSRAELLKALGSCRLVLDATGLWQRYALAEAGMDFRVLGTPGALA
jgi:UDP-N-acetyl-D-mannosaminuronate dehydrogenase